MAGNDDQRPQLENLKKQIFEEVLKPEGFKKEGSTKFVRSRNEHVKDVVDFQKSSWTQANNVQFFINYDALWLDYEHVVRAADPNEWVGPASLLHERVRLDKTNPLYQQFLEGPFEGKYLYSDKFLITPNTNTGAMYKVLRDALRAQAIPQFASLNTTQDCIRQLNKKPKHLSHADVLVEYYALKGDQKNAQDQWDRIQVLFPNRTPVTSYTYKRAHAVQLREKPSLFATLKWKFKK